MKKRVFSLILVLALVITMLPFQAGAKQGGKLVALTFDDGPSSRYTQTLLAGLKARNVKVTFFVLGELLESNLDIVQQAYEDGHEIASHSWDHPNLNTLSSGAVKSQFTRSFTYLDQVCGKGADYLIRPPYGNANASVRSVLSDYPLIYWSVDSADWESMNRYDVCETIIDTVYDGSIILVHDIYSSSIYGALDAVDILLDEGYEFVTVSELYRRRGETMRNGQFHYSCTPTGVDYGTVPAPQIFLSMDVKGNCTVKITGSSDAPIYYTLDGSYPNEESKRYTGPFKVPYLTEVRAVAAYKLNGDRSETVKLSRSVYSCIKPEGFLDENGKLVLTTKTAGAQIYYTVDNSAPTTSAILYSGPAAVPNGSYVRAVAAGNGLRQSAEWKGYFSDYGRLYLDISPSDWFYDSVERLNLMGIYKGTGAYTMAPNEKLTRGMLVTLMYRYSGEQLEEDWQPTHTFDDVIASEFYYEAVEWAYRSGIVSGYSDTSFGPEDFAKRQEVCKIVSNFLAYMGTPLPQGDPIEDFFVDYDSISNWALPHIASMVKAGLIQGYDDGSMKPQDDVIRAHFAAILCRAMEYQESYIPPEPPVEEPDPEPSEPDPTVPEEPDPEPSDPETTVPEETVAEPSVPDSTGSDTTIPETTVPASTEESGETVPEDTMPEDTVPDETVPASDPT